MSGRTKHNSAEKNHYHNKVRKTSKSWTDKAEEARSVEHSTQDRPRAEQSMSEHTRTGQNRRKESRT